MTKPNYSEFSDPHLVAIYNAVNGIEGYKQFYLDLAKKLSAKTIIDIGCGSGLLTCELAKQGYTMKGVEPSRAMLDLARQTSYSDSVEWIEGDARHLEEFHADLAIMTGHIAQFYLDDAYWLTALQSIYNALRPGGHVAFESRNPAVQPWIKNTRHSDWPSKTSPRKVNDSIAGKIEWWMQLVDVTGEKVLYENHYHFMQSDAKLVSLNELRYRTQDELTQSLIQSGFSIDNVFGDWDRSQASKESPSSFLLRIDKNR